MAGSDEVECQQAQGRIDRYFRTLDAKDLKGLRAHVGECEPCSARFSALYFAGAALGDRPIPKAAASILGTEDKRQLVDVVAPSGRKVREPVLKQKHLRLGLWISLILLAMTLGLFLVVLTQDEQAARPVPSMGTLRSSAALALDLECVDGTGAPKALPNEARCAARLRFNYRNETQRSHFLGVLLEDDQGRTHHWPKAGVLELPPSGDTSRTLEPFESPAAGSLRVVAFFLPRPEGSDALKERLQQLNQDEKVADGILVRRWTLKP